jgi:hypothetical protein
MCSGNDDTVGAHVRGYTHANEYARFQIVLFVLSLSRR